MTSSAPERRLGTTVCGKWTIERILGVGDGRRVRGAAPYRAARRAQDPPSRGGAAEGRVQALRARGQGGEQLSSPGAVEIRDIDVTEDGAPFLVMELLDGESLLDRVDRIHRIPLRELLDYTAQVLDVLVAAHSQGSSTATSSRRTSTCSGTGA